MEEYDLIFSLGANCTVAHNLLIRNLRNFSLPFDWTSIDDVHTIDFLSEAFENKFVSFFNMKI